MSPSYTAIPGFFAQDDPNIDPVSLGAVPVRFGLIDASSDRWSTFQREIAKLNDSAEKGVSYKVFFCGRHGQGYHNLAESKYGTRAWDDYWSKLDGDGELIWGPDPLLTPLGQAQALDARRVWLQEIPNGIPLPDRRYASPLKRALDTWKGTFCGLEEEFLPRECRNVTVLENCREEYGEHTCDKRTTLSQLQEIYPLPIFNFEEGFAEEDPLWTPNDRETHAHVAERATEVLNRAFAEEGRYISITAHSGFINGLLIAIGRSHYALPTGGVLPVVIKRCET